MFLEQTVRRNKPLVEAAFTLEQKGKILPDSYVIDVDTFCDNAKKILEEAEKNGIRLYFMLKQVGRNPILAKRLTQMGYAGAVVVDYKEAQVMMEHNVPIGNVGHLVQTPRALMEELVAYGPEVITVYSVEKIKQINDIAGRLGKRQGILIRVFDREDHIYSGQTAGFALEGLSELVKTIGAECPNVEIRGITSFPCYLYDEEAKDICPTRNLETVKEAEHCLEEMGYRDLLVNTPSATCVRTLEKMKEFGGNCGEPGHGLTGTTPLHARVDQPEVPAVVYVSEMSHNFQGKGYCYGGGHYRRSHVAHALVGLSLSDAEQMEVIPPSDESIDYHFGLSKECRVGDCVLMAFRFQIFVTRSDVVLLEGLKQGKLRILGIYDSLGRKKEQ